jgi:hypothetical protein
VPRELTRCSLAADKAIEKLSLTNGITENFVMLKYAATSLNGALIPGLQLVYGISFQKALGYSCLPYIFMTLHKLFNEK